MSEKASRVRTLCVQLHMERDKEVDMTKILGVFGELAGNKLLVSKCAAIFGYDQGPYMNFLFDSERMADLWEKIRTHLYEVEVGGEFLSKSSIVTCQGESGWNDYVLLHHMDPSMEVDGLPYP